MSIPQLWQRALQWLGITSERTPLDRASTLLESGHIEEAILTCRTVLFRTLVDLTTAARLALPSGSQDERAYAMNTMLSQLGVYAEPMYDAIQSWLHMGRQAANGETDEITIGSVRTMIATLDNFVRVVAVTLADNATVQQNHNNTNGHNPNNSIGGSQREPSSQPPQPQRGKKPHIPVQQQRMMPPAPQRALTAPGVPLFYESGNAPIVLATMPRVPGFVGRGHTVQRLAQLLRAGTNIALVPLTPGSTGHGLSAVASETMWLLEQDQPPTFGDGMLAINCFGWQGEEALRRIYNELSLTWKVPAIAQAQDLTAQEREVRRLLLGRRTLILLDGVELGLPIARLVDTLTSCGATVFITSRTVPHAEQLSITRLDALAATPALTLLLDRYTAAGGTEIDEDAARSICDVLGYRPLAIELAARLAATLRLPLNTLAQKLQSAQVRGLFSGGADHVLTYLMDLHLQTLDAVALNRFAALAVFAAPTWTEAAAFAVMNAVETAADLTPTIAVPQVAKTLEDFTRRGFIQNMIMPDGTSRYRLHPFTRWTAGQFLLDRPIIADWSGRAMAAHYAGVALANRKPANFPILHEEYLHIEGSLQRAFAQKEHEIVVSYGMGLYRFWQASGMWKEGRRYLIWATRAAQEIGDRPREATLAQELAVIETRLGQRGRARNRYEQSIEIWRTLGNERNMAVVLFEMGRLAQEDNEIDNARAYFEASLRSAKEAGDEHAMARALQALGLVHEASGNIEEARRYYEMVFEMRQDAHDSVAMAGALNVLGVLEYRLGRYPAARDNLVASLNAALDANSRYWEAEARFWLGETSLALRDPHEAAMQWQRALALYISQGRATDVEETQRRLARVLGSNP